VRRVGSLLRNRGRYLCLFEYQDRCRCYLRNDHACREAEQAARRRIGRNISGAFAGDYVSAAGLSLGLARTLAATARDSSNPNRPPSSLTLARPWCKPSGSLATNLSRPGDRTPALRHRLDRSPPLDPAPPASSTADPQPGSPPPAGFAPAAADATVVAGHTPDPSRRAEQADDSCSRSLPVNGRPGERRPFQVFSLARSNGKCGNPGTTHAGKISLTQRRRRLCLAGFSPPETIDPTAAVTLVGGALAKL